MCACFGTHAGGKQNDPVRRKRCSICEVLKDRARVGVHYGKDVDDRDVGEFALFTYHETCNGNNNTIVHLSTGQSCRVGVAVRERWYETQFWWCIDEVRGIPEFRSAR